MTWFRRGIAVFALVVFVAAGGSYLWLRTSLPQVSGEITVNGPGAPIEIIRDRNAVPHIYARSADDAYYALGFVHAQDRLFQMDFTRRLGAGRLSEVIGAETLRVDRFMRVLGLYRLAEGAVALLSPEARSAIESYAAGVNAYLATHPGALPPEFVALRYRPDPWRPADSMVWGRLMAMRLTGNWRTEALRARLAGRLPADRLDELWPDGGTGAPPTISSMADMAAMPEGTARSLFAGLMTAWPDEMRPITASNSWAVAGTQTATGKPVLANDPHLGFRAPGLWYLAHIEAPGLSVTGATVPGVPFTLLGHNRHIAWAFTTTESDTQDLFVERIDPADPGRYLAPQGARRFERRREVIAIRDAEDEIIEIRATRHGPVVSDIDRGLAAIAGGGHVLALAATALRADDRTVEAIFRLNQARDWTTFRDALRNFHAPQQNITYADVAGNIGFIAPARVPIRKAGKGRVPAPGWTGTHDWRGFIPFDALPMTFNPPSGRIVNANNRIVPDSYPYYLGHGGTPDYRARRINRLIDESAGRHTRETSAAMQSDTVSLMARELVPLITAITPAGEREAAAVALVRKWDGDMDLARAEPLIFTAWLRQINRRLYADELGPVFRDYWRLRPVFVRRALTDRKAWCDDVATPRNETCEAQLEAALVTALDGLEAAHGDDPAKWRWGDAHIARFRHPVFGRVPVLRDIADLRVPSGGGAFTVNRGQHRTASEDAPFASVHGPGLRAIYDLADLDDSLFMQATGQSGNPLSPRYRDRILRWRDGEYFRIPASRDRALEGAVGVLRLVPAP